MIREIRKFRVTCDICQKSFVVEAEYEIEMLSKKLRHKGWLLEVHQDTCDECQTKGSIPDETVPTK